MNITCRQRIPTPRHRAGGSPLHDPPVEPAAVGVGSRGAEEAEMAARGSDDELGHAGIGGSLEGLDRHDGIVCRGDDDGRHGNVPERRPGAGPLVVILGRGKAAERCREPVVELSHVAGQRMERRSEFLGYALAADGSRPQQSAEEFAVVKRIQPRLHVSGAGHQINRRSHGHGPRQVRRSLTSKLPQQLEDVVGPHGKTDEKHRRIRAALHHMQECRPNVLAPPRMDRQPGQPGPRAAIAQVHPKDPHSLSHQLRRRPLHVGRLMTAAETMHEQRDAVAIVPRLTVRHVIMQHQPVAVGQRHQVLFGAGGPFQPRKIAAQNCLGVSAANQGVRDKGRKHCGTSSGMRPTNNGSKQACQESTSTVRDFFQGARCEG